MVFPVRVLTKICMARTSGSLRDDKMAGKSKWLDLRVQLQQRVHSLRAISQAVRRAHSSQRHPLRARLQLAMGDSVMDQCCGRPLRPGGGPRRVSSP